MTASTRTLLLVLAIALLAITTIMQSCTIDSITDTNRIQNDIIRTLDHRLDRIEQRPFADR